METQKANKNKTSEGFGGTMSGYGFTAAGTSYDDEDRLTGYARASGTFTQSWNLTKVGDWTSVTTNGTAQNRTHGPAHELLTAGGQNISTDVKGNITLLPLNLTPQASHLTAVARTGTGGSVVYVQHDQQTIADYPVGGVASTPTYRYVYASYIDEPVVRKAAGTGGTIHYYHRNQQYSITAMTTSTGAVAERYAYTAYGQPTICNASGTPIGNQQSQIANRFTYTGREWDETLGLHHFRARWMSPLAGRFMGRDPLGYDDGPSLYEYVGGSPGRWIDPYGLIRLWGDDLPEFPDDNSNSEGDESTPAIFTTELAKQWAISHCYSSCFSCKAGLRLIKEKTIGGDLAGHIEAIARAAAIGLPDRQNSALRHCVAGGLMATYLGCSCAQCLEDYRDIAQWYSGTQPWGNTIQALHNDREGRWCGGCLGGRGDMDPLTVFLPSEAEIINCCKRKLRNGTLITGRRRPNSPYIDPEVPDGWWNMWGKPKIHFPGLVW